MVIISIIATVTSISVPLFTTYRDKARIAKAVLDIRAIEKDIMSFYADNSRFPPSLKDVGRENYVDPWGTPYQYFRIPVGKGKKGTGGLASDCRKDRFLVPINSDYDLYSMGKDKKSKLPLTAKDSRDDIIRAGNGKFVGLACLF